jgi:hypothetical protein
MASVRLSCLARNGRSPGEESLSDAIAAQAIEAQPSSGQISQGEAVGPRRTASSGEDVADPDGPVQERRPTRRRARSRSVGKGSLSPTPSRRQCHRAAETSSVVPRSGDLVEAVERGQTPTSPSNSTIRASPHRSSPTCSMIRMARATPSSARAAATTKVSKPTLPEPHPVHRAGQPVPCARRP